MYRLPDSVCDSSTATCGAFCMSVSRSRTPVGADIRNSASASRMLTIASVLSYS